MTTTNHTETQGPERVWINELPQSGRVMAYISPIREIGSGKSLSLAEYIRADLPTTTPVDPVVMRAIAHELLRRFMGVYDTGDLDDAITILTKHFSGFVAKGV